MENQGVKKANVILIIIGFILSFTGYVGLFFGSNYAFGNYDKSTRTKGKIMLVIGVIMSIVISVNS